MLQEKIDDYEKERERLKQKVADERYKVETAAREQFSQMLEQKQSEIERLKSELRTTKELMIGQQQQSADRARTQKQMPTGERNHSTSQVKVVRVNNFAGASTKQRVANSHSPSGLASGGSQNSKDSKSVKLKKGIKVV